MNRQVRLLSLIFGLLMFVIMLNLSFQQVFLADSTKARENNARVMLQEYDRERGPILVQASQVARSEPTDDALKYLRLYTNGPLYASATGFYSNVYGATGIERTDNSILNGTGPAFFVDRLAQLFGGRQVKGGAVTLTLNPASQQAAAEGIGGAIGSVTAIDPKTGAVLALVQSPSFDPNRLSSHDQPAITEYYESLAADPAQPLLNRPLVSTLPPGSTFKLVTSAAALEAGYGADSVLPGPTRYYVPGTTYGIPNDWDGSCGPGDSVTLAQSLMISCNTSFAHLGNELGADALEAQAEKFGFNHSFAIPLIAAESRFPSDLDLTTTAMSAIGQYNVAATTLQMAMVGGAIGNDGVTMNPYLVQDTRGADLQIISSTKPQPFATALSPENAQALLGMMELVVKQGTGTMAQIPGVRVGGKTGTAETGGGRPDVSWFVGVAPLDDPKIAVAVAIEDGMGAASGPLAMTTARNVIEATLP